jgi:hypothetical protein
MYSDGIGNATTTNPLTTDANGFWSCYAPIEPYDIKTSATNYGSRLECDKVPDGAEYVVSNQFPIAGIAAYRRSTSRTLTAGYLQTWENPVGSVKASIDYTGLMALAGNFSATNGSFGGTLSANGGATVASAFTYTGATGSFSLTAGSIETADLAANAVVVTRTADGTADQTFNFAAFNVANYVDVTNCTLTFTPASSASEIVVMAHCPCDAAGAGALNSWFAIKDGTGTILHQSEESTAASGHTSGPTLLYRVTGLSTSQTFKVSAQCEAANMVTNNATWAAGRRTRIIAMEFKR